MHEETRRALNVMRLEFREEIRLDREVLWEKVQRKLDLQSAEIQQRLDIQLQKVQRKLDLQSAEVQRRLNVQSNEVQRKLDILSQELDSTKAEIIQETKQCMGILHEDFQHKLDLVVEGHQMLNEKLDRYQEETNSRLERLERRF